jgi:hypothetical protein
MALQEGRPSKRIRQLTPRSPSRQYYPALEVFCKQVAATRGCGAHLTPGVGQRMPLPRPFGWEGMAAVPKGPEHAHPLLSPRCAKELYWELENLVLSLCAGFC